jgi:hypothetical protein
VQSNCHQLGRGVTFCTIRRQNPPENGICRSAGRQNRYLSPFKQQTARKRAVGLTIAQHGFFVASSQQPTRPSHDDAIVMIAWFGMTIGGAS